jgi:hypothetical protein
MQFLKGVLCSFSTPSQSTRFGLNGGVLVGGVFVDAERLKLMFRGEVFWESWGRLSYWPIINEYIL